MFCPRTVYTVIMFCPRTVYIVIMFCLRLVYTIIMFCLRPVYTVLLCFALEQFTQLLCFALEQFTQCCYALPYTLFHEMFSTFFKNKISLPERRNKRKSVLEITKMYYFKI